MKGLRILDLTRVLAGPWAVQHLADQGADVIKVESVTGDETRAFGPVVDGASTYFLCANRNKRSIALDLKSDAGVEVLRGLLAWADVLVENFRPGVADRLGFGWEDVREQHPRLVYVAIHAFGDQDPTWSTRAGYDLLLQHMGGATAMTGFAGSPPTKHPVSVADLMSGMFAVQAILQGVLHREWTGEGQKIVVNMMQVQASCLAYHSTRYAVTGELGQQRGNSHFGIVPYDVFRCSDGWFTVACANDSTWLRLESALGLTHNLAWLTNAQRVADRVACAGAVQRALDSLSVEQASEVFSRAGVPGGPVMTADKTLNHPTVQTVTVDHEVFGTVSLPGPALQTRTTLAEHRAPPALGQHRDSVLVDAGLIDRADELMDSGAFGEHTAR